MGGIIQSTRDKNTTRKGKQMMIKAYDSDTLELMGTFECMEEFRHYYPGAEIVYEEIEDSNTIAIYC